jgi:glycosyltransferase involved in cell wall biosynthesis
MRRADAVIVPSLRDDAPLTIAEAQALGVPVVAFDQGGAAVMGRLPGASVSLVGYAPSVTAAREFARALDGIAADGGPRRPFEAFGLRELEGYIAKLYASVISLEATGQ